MTHGWPFADGKGCFGKDRQGKELPFLERLFLLLAFPNLELPGQPGRTLGEAIRWKRADQLAALGLPAGTAAFEIVDVRLVEAAVYPQYASGSFNKTCAKWGLYSPTPSGAPSKRLSRECICVPAAHPNLRQLAATATAADVYRHAALVAAPRASSTPAVAPGPVSRKRRARAGVQWGDLHVALWDKEKRQRVPSKAYSGDIHSYLAENPHLEVYNHQDVAAKSGSQLLAGQKLTQVTNPTDGAARVVLWDTQAHCKLPSAECPTPAGLCAFLRTQSHSHLEVWSGQQPPPTPPPLPSTAVAADIIHKGAQADEQMLTSPLPLAGPKLEAAAPPLKPKPLAPLSSMKPLAPMSSTKLLVAASRWVRTVGL